MSRPFVVSPILPWWRDEQAFRGLALRGTSPSGNITISEATCPSSACSTPRLYFNTFRRLMVGERGCGQAWGRDGSGGGGEAFIHTQSQSHRHHLCPASSAFAPGIVPRPRLCDRRGDLWAQGTTLAVAGDLKFGPNEGSSSRLDSRTACGSSFVQTRARALVLTSALYAGQVWFKRGLAHSS